MPTRNANTSQSAQPEARQQSLLPVYLVVGDDRGKVDRVIGRMRKRFEQFGDLAFISDEFDGASAAGSTIASVCNTVPFASPKRLVIVRHAEKLRKKDMDAVTAYVNAPCETAVLLLVAEKLSDKTAAHANLRRAVAGVGKSAVINCAAKKGQGIVDEIRDHASKWGFTLSVAGAQALVKRVGTDTVALEMELEKLALSVPRGCVVSDADIARLVARSEEVKPWDFTAAFAARDLAACLRLWNAMQAPNPISLLGFCVERIRELICAQSLMAHGRQRELAKALGKQDWQVKNHVQWARRFTPGELEAALRAAAETDRAMKSGSDPQDAFLAWLIRTLAPRR